MNTRRTNRSNYEESWSADNIDSFVSTWPDNHTPQSSLINMPPSKPLEILGIRPKSRAEHRLDTHDHSIAKSLYDNQNYGEVDQQSRSNFRTSGSSLDVDRPSGSDAGGGSGGGSGSGSSSSGLKSFKKAGQLIKMANRLAVPMMKALKASKSKSHHELDEDDEINEKHSKHQSLIKLKGKHIFQLIVLQNKRYEN